MGINQRFLSGLENDDVLNGGAGYDQLYGNSGNDILNGGTRDDVLDGGTGNDTLIGGSGNDIYYVDSKYDIVIENSADNTGPQRAFQMGLYNDAVIASVSYTLTDSADIEDFFAVGILTGSASNTAINLTGNNLDQGMYGNNANNILDGKGGNDILLGMNGDDVLIGGDGNDGLIGGLGNDYLYGGAGNDLFEFNIGASSGANFVGTYGSIMLTGGTDIVDGGADTDTIFMRGEIQDYSITHINATDYQITVRSGIADISSTEKMIFKNIEYLAFGTLDSLINGFGYDTISLSSLVLPTAFADILTAPSDANWTADGGAGNDTLYGNADNDILSGGLGDDYLFGQAGNDTLDGGGGNDTLAGGTGNDTYLLSKDYTGTTTIVEAANSGIDTVYGDFTEYTLGNNLENYYSDRNDDYVGIIGNGLDNILSTYSSRTNSSETFFGMGGNDTLIGGLGDDYLSGGAGNDKLNGGAGADLFIFDDSLNSLSNVDIITDFTTGQDHLELSTTIFSQLTGGVNAENLRINTTGKAADSNDYLIFNSINKTVYYDVDGNGALAAVAFAKLIGVNTLTSSDFSVFSPG